ncbi:MAG: hypothetical protein V3S55_07665 [Nitrospiraceae bacterium]
MSKQFDYLTEGSEWYMMPFTPEQKAMLRAPPVDPRAEVHKAWGKGYFTGMVVAALLILAGTVITGLICG